MAKNDYLIVSSDPYSDISTKKNLIPSHTGNSVIKLSVSMKQVIQEAKSILDVDKVVASILLVEDLRIQKN